MLRLEPASPNISIVMGRGAGPAVALVIDIQGHYEVDPVRGQVQNVPR